MSSNQTPQAATPTREYELVINNTNMQQHVDIIGPKGEKTSVNIMPKRRVELPKGWTTCGNWQALNVKAVKVHKATADAAGGPTVKGDVVADLQSQVTSSASSTQDSSATNKATTQSTKAKE